VGFGLRFLVVFRKNIALVGNSLLDEVEMFGRYLFGRSEGLL